MHSPGHGNGLVNTVTVATPLIVRTGFICKRRKTSPSNVSRPASQKRLYAPTITSLANCPSARGYFRVSRVISSGPNGLSAAVSWIKRNNCASSSVVSARPCLVYQSWVRISHHRLH